ERGLLGLDLVAHDLDVMGRGADEMNLVLAQDPRETRVLGEKPVARMHGLGAGDLAGREDRGDVEVGILGRGRPHAYAFVGEADMHGVGVGLGVDGDGLDAQLLARAQDAQRDLAAIGYEDLGEHLFRVSYSMTTSGSPYSTGDASSTRMRVTVPARCAGI